MRLGNSVVYFSTYVLKFYCKRITPQRTNTANSITNPTNIITGPGRICCGEFIEEPHHDIDICILFELYINSDIVIINTYEFNFNTYIELWDKNQQIII